MISETRSSEDETDGSSFSLGRCGYGRERGTAEGTLQGEQCCFGTCLGFEWLSGDNISLTDTFAVIHQFFYGLAA